MMDALRQKLVQAWELRVNRDLEASLALCTELKQQVKLPAGSFDLVVLEKSLAHTSWQLLTEIAVLWASLVRALQGMEQGASLVAEVEKFIWKHGTPNVFALPFEKGLIAFCRGNYALALENFISAAPKASAAWEKLCCAANTLFCLENLGLPEDNALEKIMVLLTSEKNTPASQLVQSQIAAYQMRRSFRDGKVRDALGGVTKQDLDQPNYYRLWIRTLPFHNSYEPLNKNEIALLYEKRFFLHKEYRARSLKGVLHPEDLATIRATELADRLYLWVWKWLLAPETFDVRKVITPLKNLDLQREAHQMTREDLCLIRNALLWLGLFDPAHEKTVMEKLSGLDIAAYPVFALEALFIHYCRALRDGKATLAQDLLTQITDRPLCKSKELYFCPMIKFLGGKKSTLPEHLKPFLQHLTLLIAPAEQKSKTHITIDVALGQVEIRQNKKPIYSKPMASAMELLSSKRSVSLDEFSSVCLGIHHFDPLIHMPRVYNLLARLKALKNLGVVFRIKSGLVIAEGEWSGVGFVRNNAFSKQLSYQPEWTSFLFSQSHADKHAPVHTKTAPKAVSWQGFIKRAEVEKLLERPRSTTNRLLNHWMEQGMIERKGNARSARYRLKDISEIMLESI